MPREVKHGCLARQRQGAWRRREGGIGRRIRYGGGTRERGRSAIVRASCVVRRRVRVFSCSGDPGMGSGYSGDGSRREHGQGVVMAVEATLQRCGVRLVFGVAVTSWRSARSARPSLCAHGALHTAHLATQNHGCGHEACWMLDAGCNVGLESWTSLSQSLFCNAQR